MLVFRIGVIFQRKICLVIHDDADVIRWAHQCPVQLQATAFCPLFLFFGLLWNLDTLVTVKFSSWSTLTTYSFNLCRSVVQVFASKHQLDLQRPWWDSSSAFQSIWKVSAHFQTSEWACLARRTISTGRGQSILALRALSTSWQFIFCPFLPTSQWLVQQASWNRLSSSQPSRKSDARGGISNINCFRGMLWYLFAQEFVCLELKRCHRCQN